MIKECTIMKTILILGVVIFLAAILFPFRKSNNRNISIPLHQLTIPPNPCVVDAGLNCLLKNDSSFHSSNQERKTSIEKVTNSFGLEKSGIHDYNMNI